MTTTCPRCGRTTEPSADETEVWLDAAGERNVCSYACAGCGTRVHALADDATVDGLLANGAVTVVHRVPLEVVERAPHGPRVAPDEILDAHVLMDDDERFRAEIDSLDGEPPSQRATRRRGDAPAES